MVRTRARYVDFEPDGRAAAGEAAPRAKAKQRLAETRWGRLTPAEKAAFIRRLDEVDESEGLVAERVPRANNAWNRVQALRRGNQTNFPDFMVAAANAAEDYDGLRLAHHNHAINLNHLHAVIQGHAGHLASTTAYCTSLRTQALADETIARNVMNGLLHNADVPPDLPARTDLAPKIYESWLTERHQGRLRRLRTRRFRTTAPEGHWYGSWPYPGGAQGNAARWVRLDDEDNVVQRVVQKQTFKDRQEWASLTEFTDPLRVANERWPYEFYCQRALNYQEGNTHIVVPEADPHAVVSDRDLNYTFMMEYCPYGDLEDLMIATNAPFPEPFLWRIFYALALTAFHMEWGHQNLDDENPSVEWAQIVHRDLKPGNVFLAAANPNFFPAYPTPLVGDFGAAIITTANDPFNPNLFLDGVRTDGFVAPEQRSYVHAENFNSMDRQRILSPTNIYAVGVIMYCLIKGTRDPRQPNWLGEGDSDGLNVWTDAPAGPAYVFKYSDRLHELVDECLPFLTLERITSRDLLQRVTDICHLDPDTSDDADDDDSDDGTDPNRPAEILRNRDPAKLMVNQLPDGLPDDDPRRLRFLRADRYALGLARVALPPIPAVPAV